MQGLLLGLATGTTCLAYCAPVLVPLLLGEGKRTAQNWSVLVQFLGGRLGGYLLFGLLAWAANRLLLESAAYRSRIFAAAYIALAVPLLIYGLVKAPATCAGSAPEPRTWLSRWPALLPVSMGFLTGLNLCPPFLLALTGAASSGSLLQNLVFFGAFFVGTSLYFIPLPFLGTFRRVQALRTIGKFAAVIVALYYLVTGIILFAGGTQAQ